MGCGASIRASRTEDIGEVLKLYYFDEEGHLQLNETNLERVLNAAKGFPFVVLSVAGDFRGGKSFLLNIIMLYLLKDGKAGWLKDPALITGFPSKKCTETVTTGIDVWSKPFIIKDRQGKSIAVILLDTQGMNDNKASKIQATKIFAFSMLLSDIQINNIRNIIGSDKLEQLHFFLEFAKYAVSSDSTRKKLIMLVRDWQNSESYGFDGGDVHLKEALQKNGENAQILKSIHSFMEVECCLLPSPGEKVIEQKEFSGPISDVNPKFRKHVVELTAELFTGNPAEGKSSTELRNWCHLLEETFRSPQLPEPRTVIGMHAMNMFAEARDESMANFQTSVEAELMKHKDKCLSHNELKKLCSDAEAAALKLYDKERRGFDVQQIRKELREELMSRITTKKNHYFEKNEVRTANMNQRISNEMLRTFHESMTTATETPVDDSIFDFKSKDIIDKVSHQFLQRGIDAERFLNYLQDQMKEGTQIYRTVNEKKLNDRSSFQALKHYTEKMEELCDRSISDDEFITVSKRISEESCSFSVKQFVGSEQMRDACLQKMRDDLDVAKNIFHRRYHKKTEDKQKDKAKKQLQEAEKIKQKQQQEEAEQLRRALEELREKERLHQIESEKKHKAQMEALEKKHETEMTNQSSKKRSGYWDDFCSAGIITGKVALGAINGYIKGAAVGSPLGPFGAATAGVAGGLYEASKVARSE